MAARTSTANLGLTGIPLFIALELIAYGRGEQSHQESMRHLEKAYGWIRAYLSIMYEKKQDDFYAGRIPKLGDDGTPVKQSIYELLIETGEEVSVMRSKYDASFEGLKSCSTVEKEFSIVMCGVFERLALIVAYAGIVDKMRDIEEVNF